MVKVMPIRRVGVRAAYLGGTNSPASSAVRTSSNENPESSCCFTHRAWSGACSGQRVVRPRRPMLRTSGAGRRPCFCQRPTVVSWTPAAAATCSVVVQVRAGDTAGV